MATNILIVDDITYIRLLFRLSLEKVGYKIYDANNISEALQIVKRGNIDIIILDLVLPGKDGIDFLVYLQKYYEKNNITQKIPVILMTAFKNDKRIEKAIELGVISILTKPIDINTLKNEIEEVLKGKRSLREKRSLTVLVAEPDRKAFFTFDEELEKEGYKKIMVHNSRELLSILQRTSVDLIFLSTDINDIDPLYILKHLTNLLTDTKVLPVIAEYEPGIIAKLQEYDIKDYLMKPLTKEVIKKKLDKLIQEIEAERNRKKIKNFINIDKFPFDLGEIKPIL